MTEVVFWKKYSIADGVIHNLSSNLGAGYVDNSGPAGLSKSLVDNYLNADGTPINPADGIFKDFNLTFKGRDGRLWRRLCIQIVSLSQPHRNQNRKRCW